MNITSLTTPLGLQISRHVDKDCYQTGTSALANRLDSERGCLFSSSYEYPGRYSRWDFGFVNPPLAITATGINITIEALNERGSIILAALKEYFSHDIPYASCQFEPNHKILITLHPASQRVPEEERSRTPGVFSIIRLICHQLKCDDDKLGLYGAFGYDLAFQFEPITPHLKRCQNHRDLVLYLPDELLVLDHHNREAQIIRYEFSFKNNNTKNLPRNGVQQFYTPANHDPGRGDHVAGEYAQSVSKAKEHFAKGSLFEVVPGQVFYAPSAAKPSIVSNILQKSNPAPYSFFINLGQSEYLVGASPEMYVRVTGNRVETCPISGTIARGKDAIEDEAQIRKLLNSAKDLSELTMCTDVDRNDKARICQPGSVRVIGRRQIELYSRLIHTVDHVEGILRPEMDALDAFLSHSWAVTVTGAPKKWAMQFIEENEKSPRRWYGGAIGWLGFNGNMNTGLTLRTIHIDKGIAQIRAGATLLFDSDPKAEEQETELKASALMDAIRSANEGKMETARSVRSMPGKNKNILLVDHEDSFVHMLADYFRQTGANVHTLRGKLTTQDIQTFKPHMLVLSPGPGRPSDFDCQENITLACAHNLPVFGICLGLQALVEYFGGTLAQLDQPVHGKPSVINISNQSGLFDGLPAQISIGRYHSLVADKAHLPDCLDVIAKSEDDAIMAITHKQKPMAAVQFHPESIMSLRDNVGLKIIENAISKLTDN